jgi:hypothetical protein
MRPNIRKRTGENLTDSAIEDVISKLESDTPITKKAACAALSITYNTTRLTKIIEEYKERKEFMTKRKKELRNTPVTESDASYMVSSYLEGNALQDIADSSFRSVGIVKRTLAKYNVPVRSSSIDYLHPVDLCYEVEPPSDYEVGDLVYAARYGCPAEITGKFSDRVFKIQLIGDHYRSAYQPSHELSDLRKLQTELGINIEHMPQEEVNHHLNEGLRNARKRDKDK